MSCKFCGVTAEERHINRDRLCAKCATLLDKIKYQPEKISLEQYEQFMTQCRRNYQLGMFVPVAQRRTLKVEMKPIWSCSSCGTTKEVDRDPHYKRYCIACTTDIRKNRKMPKKSSQIFIDSKLKGR